jgi:hypothetical protein
MKRAMTVDVIRFVIARFIRAIHSSTYSDVRGPMDCPHEAGNDSSCMRHRPAHPGDPFINMHWRMRNYGLPGQAGQWQLVRKNRPRRYTGALSFQEIKARWV